jgi:hypothetical protein
MRFTAETAEAAEQAFRILGDLCELRGRTSFFFFRSAPSRTLRGAARVLPALGTALGRRSRGFGE